MVFMAAIVVLYFASPRRVPEPAAAQKSLRATNRRIELR
jgi:hypothetical protein